LGGYKKERSKNQEKDERKNGFKKYLHKEVTKVKAPETKITAKRVCEE
jgi:hypothetical protein